MYLLATSTLASQNSVCSRRYLPLYGLPLWEHYTRVRSSAGGIPKSRGAVRVNPMLFHNAMAITSGNVSVRIV
jgi:hypothetical protein